ncbi:protein EPIDERMAL PATTERNING FACTOR 1-like [Selaginella moellendorffii]|uniref:protein EPIDERMAL PATTERNING FACTOR 1-like n=1 Tax=Selaginella moellendorffii TaxID=88036 RepID=UPI000D1C5513|nr:protein EPIDERMAL PATTERNING FACTOR 1-like [Selaginella moellendorffii]|eukprot:XP_024515692.1 protein EPIDERMAL PATTERNING FACTOR 1-like [Selaginella moellendorffii]
MLLVHCQAVPDESKTIQAQITINSTAEEVPRNRSKELSMMAGSALPDCSHACGPCSPCLRVTISFMCLESRDSEACPSTYRCMCHGKSFPVP